MPECLGTSAVFGLEGGLALGAILALIVAIFHPLMRGSTGADWDARRRKYGFWGALAVQFLETSLGIGLFLFLVSFYQCCHKTTR